MTRFADSSELREAALLAGRFLRGQPATGEAPRRPAAAPPDGADAAAHSASTVAGRSPSPTGAPPDLIAAATSAVEAGVRRYAAAPRGPGGGA